MDNQQERFDLRLAWLAGIIEGEGWVSLVLVKSLKRDKRSYPAYVPNMGLTNTDISMVEEAEKIFNHLSIKYRSQIRKAYVGKDGISRKEKKEISVATHESFSVLAKAIRPYMVGEKKYRIDKVMRYLEIRSSKPRSGKGSRYGQEEHDIYLSLYAYRGKVNRSKILNDYTPGSQYSDKI
jgi:hypothetical protein